MEGKNKNIIIMLLGAFILGMGGFWLSVPVVQAAAGINRQINFQGKVTNTNGTNVTNSSYTFLFCLYTTGSPATACTSGADNDAVWRESKSITVTDGIFQTDLGDTTTLPGSVDFNTDSIYLGINFNANGQMTPLVRFTAAPYAMNADRVHGLTVTDTTGTLTIANGKAVSFADAFATSGAFATTLTVSGITNATLPSGTITLADLATSQTLTNKIVGSTGLTFTGAATDITTGAGEDLVVTANGAGIINLNDAVTISGTITFSGLSAGGVVQAAAGTGILSAGTIGASSITADSLDFTEFKDSMTLDASTDIAVTGSNVFSVTNSGTGNSFVVNDASGDTTPFVIDNAGNVGVGTTAPTTLFELYGSGADVISTLTAADATYDPLIKFRTGVTPAVQFTLGIDNSDAGKFKISSSDGFGADEFVIDSNGVTSIANLNLGATNFDEDAGAVSWVDMSVTAASPVGTVESYTAQIDGNPLLTISAESDGAGSIQNSGVSIGNTTLTAGAKLGVTQSSTSTTAGSLYGTYGTVAHTGIVASGTDTTYGTYNSVTRTGATGGTINTYGEYTTVTADSAGAGTSTAYGTYVAVSGADTNYAGIFMGGNFGIGTATPTSLFSVGATSQFQVDSSGAIVATTGVTSSGSIVANGGISLAGSQSFSAAALSFVDLGLITQSSTANQGLRLPNAASATPSNPTSGEGYLAWDVAGNQLITYNGSAWTTVGGVGSVTWDTIGDAATAGAIAMNEYTQTLDWNTAATAAAFDALTVTLTNDATTDANTQRGFVVANLDDAASTGVTETLAAIENRDGGTETITNGLLIQNTAAGTSTMTNALSILENAGTITTAINIGDNVTTGISIGTGVTTGISIASGGITSTGEIFSTNTGTGLSLRVDDVASDTTPFVVDTDGSVGIGTATPARSLDVFQTAAAPQLRLSKDLTYYSEFTVDAVGDLQMAATGSDIRALSENLWICDNDACPALTLTGDGNIFVENVLKFGNGVYLKNDSATELTVYDSNAQAMLVFDQL